MKTALRCIDRVLETSVVAALAVMVAVVGTNVFLRYALSSALSWGDEVPQILLVWITFLGAALAIRKHEQFEFDLLVRSLPRGPALALRVATQVLVIVTTAALIYWSGEVTVHICQWVMPATGISRAFVYAACPVGCCFILLYAVDDLIATVRGRGEETEEAAEEIRI